MKPRKVRVLSRPNGWYDIQYRCINTWFTVYRIPRDQPEQAEQLRKLLERSHENS